MSFELFSFLLALVLLPRGSVALPLRAAAPDDP
jgi:hypothetical protein